MGEKLHLIGSFAGEFRFLSNFYPSLIVGDVTGIEYPTAEHAYQAFKTHDLRLRRKVAQCHSPGAAKRFGQTIPLRAGWKTRSLCLRYMAKVLAAKFDQNPELAEQLVATYPAVLIEGNNWGDTFWGAVDGQGLNHLGRLLMARRQYLRKERT